jgi:diguanylate cyclase (GGDEF)-like protein/PAS domain S-box-containing protein
MDVSRTAHNAPRRGADSPSGATRSSTHVQRDPRLVTILDSIPDGVYVIEAESEQVVYTNHGLQQMTGLSRQAWESAGMRVPGVLHPDDRPKLLAAWESMRSGAGPTVVRYRLRTADGRLLHVEDHGYLMLRDGPDLPVLIAGYLRDVTHRGRRQGGGSRRATHDELTGLPNRGLFADLLEASLARAAAGKGQTAVLFCDLDGFKLVNDSLGHAAGDELLREIGARLTRITRRNDVIARQSGDEFLVLVDVPGGPRDMQRVTQVVAGRVREAITSPFQLAGHEVSLGVSIGMSLYPRDGSTAAELLAAADHVMYEHKSVSHRRRGDGESDPASELRRFSALNQAFREREFEFRYLPVVELASGRTIGVETLVRWQAGDRAYEPGDLFELLERAGMARELTELVVTTASAQQAVWAQDGLQLTVSVNLPSAFLAALGADRLLAGIRAAGADPHSILVEMTPRGDDDESLAVALSGLVGAGMRVVLDDFGSGYATLRRLAQLPVGAVKIDGSFVREIPDGLRACTIARSIISLAASLGLRTVGADVATPAQHDFLLRAGCLLGQGPLYGPPLHADDVPRGSLRGR